MKKEEQKQNERVKWESWKRRKQIQNHFDCRAVPCFLQSLNQSIIHSSIHHQSIHQIANQRLPISALSNNSSIPIPLPNPKPTNPSLSNRLPRTTHFTSCNVSPTHHPYRCPQEVLQDRGRCR